MFFTTYSCWLITYFFCKKIINCWRHFFAANDPFRGGNTGGNCRLPPLIPRAVEENLVKVKVDFNEANKSLKRNISWRKTGNNLYFPAKRNILLRNQIFLLVNQNARNRFAVIHRKLFCLPKYSRHRAYRSSLRIVISFGGAKVGKSIYVFQFISVARCHVVVLVCYIP